MGGGKDSTAMLHLMLEKGENVHSIVFYDGGWEWPQTYDHLALIEQKTGMKVTILKSAPDHTFDYWMCKRPVKRGYGHPDAGKVYRIGKGWPAPIRRWCSREKQRTIDKYIKTVSDAVSCIGIAFDERHRCDRAKGEVIVPTKYPLVEYEYTEAMCLEYCKKLGYHWGGLYDHIQRISCYCCPLARKGQYKMMRKSYPELWQKILEKEDLIPLESRTGFLRLGETARELDARFAAEDEKEVK